MIQREENRWVLSEVLKLENVDCWRTERGSLFQEVGPETEKACKLSSKQTKKILENQKNED